MVHYMCVAEYDLTPAPEGDSVFFVSVPGFTSTQRTAMAADCGGVWGVGLGGSGLWVAGMRGSVRCSEAMSFSTGGGGGGSL